VSKAFAAVQAAQEEAALQATVLETEAASAELARQLRTAGNISELALDEALARAEQAKLDLAGVQLERYERRTELDKLLGLWGARATWKVEARLPALPESDGPLADAEALALRRRLDVEAARRQAELFSRAVDLASTSRALGLVQVGVDFHRDADGPRLTGPSLSIELPIFDQRQAVIARLQAQQRASERRLSMLAVEARSDARLGRERLAAARLKVQHYQRVVLPLREKVVEQAQLHFNGMVLGVPALLSARREQLEAKRAAVGALRDYWFARAELERTLGGPLP
jgi:cobalt-zinc-cadmium efflux system outer membrane protein